MNARRRSLDKWQEEDSKTSSLADSNSSRSTPTHVGQLLTESGGRPSGLGDDCSAGASGKGSGCSETGQQMIMCRAGEGPLSSPQSDSEIRQLSVGRLAGIDDDNLSPSGGTHMNTHNSLSAGRNGQHSCPLPQYSHPQLPSLHHSNHPHHSHHQLHHHHHHHHNTLHPHLGHIPHSGTNMHNRSHQLPHLIYVNNNPSVVGRSCDTDGSNVPLLGQTSDEVGSFSANFIPDQQHHHHHHHQQPVISSQHIYLQGNAHGMAQMPQHYNGPPAAVAPASFDSNRHTQAVYASTLKGPLLEVAFGQDNSSGANNCSLLHSSQHTSSQLRALMTPTQQFFPASLDQGHRALTEQALEICSSMAAAAASAESNIYLPQATQPSITNEVHPCPQDEPPISKHLTRSVTRTEGSELDCHHFTSTKLDADLIRHEMYNSKQLSETLALSNASCSSSSSFVAISAASSIAQHLATEPNILPKDTNQTDVNDEIAIEEALGADVSSHGDTDYLLGGELEDVDVETDCQTSLHSAAEEVDTGSLKSLLKGPSEKELGLFVTKFTTVDLSEDKEQGSIEGEGALLKKRCVEYAVFQRECESFNTNLIVSEEHYSIIESLEGQLASHVRRQSSALTNEITKKMNTPTTDD